MAKFLRITAKRDGFRRAGITHTGTVDHPVEKLSASQIAALKGEKNLVVHEIDLPDPEPETRGRKSKD